MNSVLDRGVATDARLSSCTYLSNFLGFFLNVSEQRVENDGSRDLKIRLVDKCYHLRPARRDSSCMGRFDTVICSLQIMTTTCTPGLRACRLSVRSDLDNSSIILIRRSRLQWLNPLPLLKNWVCFRWMRIWYQFDHTNLQDKRLWISQDCWIHHFCSMKISKKDVEVNYGRLGWYSRDTSWRTWILFEVRSCRFALNSTRNRSLTAS